MKAAQASSRIKVLIVTPCLNSARYIDETIASVVAQSGDFDIHYHIQDGGSTDATVDRLKIWAARLEPGTSGIPSGAPIYISWASEKDASMYEGIQKGFDALLGSGLLSEEDRVVMSWINADDQFTLHAFQTVTRFLSEYPGEHWVTGIVSVVREDGCIAGMRIGPLGYGRAALARGIHDGRILPFVGQEGTFWTLELWQRCGGWRPGIRYAGDWDLWRRMAGQARLVNLIAVLGHHRRRPGQISQDMARYWTELDALLQSEPTVDMDRVGYPAATTWEDYDRASVAAWDSSTQQWKLYGESLRREGLLHCFSDCLVSSWSRYGWGRWLITTYRRWRGIEIEP